MANSFMKKTLFLLVIVLAFCLRFFKLGLNPPALYWDEASLGYNAFSVATSLHDEHGELLPIARFIAFGDYKPPGYIYSAVPSIWFFGLNEFSIRIPSMLSGLFMVVLTYFLAKEMFGKDKIAVLSSFILAVSSWAIHFSRAAFEANLAAFFNLAGIYFFMISLRKRWMIVVSSVFFVLSFYTFNANRIIAPLILVALCFLNFRTIITASKKWLVIAIVTSLIMLLPSISYLASPESRLRFQEVSIFNNLEPVKVSNERITADGNLWWSKLLHNRRILFADDFLKHYFDNFSLRFLFSHGDVNPRLAVQTMGQMYVWELPFLLIGLYYLIKRKEKNLRVLIVWMLIAPIPAATARETPHALRILSILPSFQIITAYGLYEASIWIKGISRPAAGKILFSVICILLSANIFYYLHDYYIHFPKDWSGEWQYGYKQMVEYVSKVEDKYDRIYVTNSLGRPYIYFAFYQKYGVKKFQAYKNAQRDWFGFWDVKSLGKIQFEFDSLANATGKILLVNTKGNIPGDFRLLNVIKNPSGEDVFWIAER